MSDLPPDLVRLASDLLDAEASDPVFISIDGRTVAPTLVRRAVRTLLVARLAASASSGPEDEAAPVRVGLDEVSEHVLAWGSVVVSEAVAADLVQVLADEGQVAVVRREPRGVWLRAASPGPSPSPSSDPLDDPA
jgi:hypothetical protein